MSKNAIIIGAGPAGLTAAYELLKRTDIIPIVLEKSEYIGGISRTIDYKGNRMDMGPHRFFSKSDRVMDWWLSIMPLEKTGDDNIISYQQKSRSINGKRAGVSGESDKKMLIIKRLTRIYFLRKFFSYPIQLSLDTLRMLGIGKTISILISFLWIRLFPRKHEVTLEDFMINKFGKSLYLLFFKDYTEKVWGVPCDKIPAEWGAQRIKGVSLGKAIKEAIRSMKSRNDAHISQKNKETSLIEQFLYPKYGPGSLWEEVARQIQEMGGEVHLNQDVKEIELSGQKISGVRTQDLANGQPFQWEGDYYFSTMPVKELIADMCDAVPPDVQEIASQLQYRDFINVGILLKQMIVADKESGAFTKHDLKDNWIYIQERDVKVGRLMIYNNWGDGMVKDPETIWIGMEYFCNVQDEIWSLNDEEVKRLAIDELERLSLARATDILDITVKRMEKTYPAYFGSYSQFDKIRAFTDQFPELFLIGRNGMHKYNNADHSMLTAMVSVDNILEGVLSKENIWSINTEQEYHEEKKANSVISRQDDAKKARRPMPSPFLSYIVNNKLNQSYCIAAILVYIIQFLLFKHEYPFANYMPDSYYYLDAAATNADVNIWPVGYSKMLRLISVFAHSDKVLVCIQYFFMQIASLILLFTLIYHLRPGKLAKNILLAFFLFNPISLYVANYISADSFFIGASLLWISSLIWIIFQPKPSQAIYHGLLILFCITLRYNAIYYPIISGIAILMSRQKTIYKAVFMTVMLSLVGWSVWYTTSEMKDTTGHAQFSAFGGWQLANNALYMYEHISPKDRKVAPKQFASLDKMVREHMDTLQKVKLTHDDSVNTYFYLWSSRGPLMQYMEQQYKKDSTTPTFRRWASEAPLYFSYAKYLIASYPVTFASSFMLPNAIKFFVPPTEFLSTYNMGRDSVGIVAQSWFQYKNPRVSEQKNKHALMFFPNWYSIFTVLVNLLLIIHVFGVIMFKSLPLPQKPAAKLFLMLVAFWSFNAAFSISASPIVLRYQLFPVTIAFCTAIIIGEWIYTQPSKKVQTT